MPPQEGRAVLAIDGLGLPVMRSFMIGISSGQPTLPTFPGCEAGLLAAITAGGGDGCPCVGRSALGIGGIAGHDESESTRLNVLL